MKTLFVFLLVVHGAIHLLGLTKSYDVPVLNYKLVQHSQLRNLGLSLRHLWWIDCFLFWGIAVVFLLNKNWWWMPAIAAIIVSQFLIFNYWKEAHWGTVLNLIILCVVTIAAAGWNFSRKTDKEIQQLLAEASKQQLAVTNQTIQTLPYPVKNWLQHSGALNRHAPYAVQVQQSGVIRQKQDQRKWNKMNAVQYSGITTPGFVWKMEMNIMPLVKLSGRDKWMNGKGAMDMKLLSLFSVAKGSGEKIDQSALQRWLAEICWLPQAALSKYISWATVDSVSAKATLTYMGVSGSVLFLFDSNGNITGCKAKRYMENEKDAILQEWEVQCSDYVSFDGISVPTKSEVTWKLPEGDFTWYRFQVKGIKYLYKLRQ